MQTLNTYDLNWAIRRLPKNLKDLMLSEDWQGRIFISGGYIRAIVAGETINDIDVFVNSKNDAELLAYKLCDDKKQVVQTDNAFTIKGKLPIQIIHRWVFDKPEDVSNSFDFTICCAVIWYTDKWNSFCDPNFYPDLAAKRLVYREPVRNEDAGGSMLRILKYYQRGYRIPLYSLAAVIARLVKGIDTSKQSLKDEKGVTIIINALLKEVDPSVDPEHLSHLPNIENPQ